MKNIVLGDDHYQDTNLFTASILQNDRDHDSWVVVVIITRSLFSIVVKIKFSAPLSPEIWAQYYGERREFASRIRDRDNSPALQLFLALYFVEILFE